MASIAESTALHSGIAETLKQRANYLFEDSPIKRGVLAFPLQGNYSSQKKARPKPFAVVYSSQEDSGPIPCACQVAIKHTQVAIM
jgi:hypothetical protein